VRRFKAEKNFQVEALGADGVEVQDPFALVGTSFAVARELAEKVRDATGRRDFPLVLAGNWPEHQRRTHAVNHRSRPSRTK
jgi:hypothetical protein